MSINQTVGNFSEIIPSFNLNVLEKPLLTIEEYIDSLNDYDNAHCQINRYGNLACSDVKGVFIETRPDTFSIILGEQFNPILYRGLNNDLVFMPDSLRYELFDGKERVRHSINWIKKHEFLNLMSKTPYFKRICELNICNYKFNFDFEAVAKHYNYMSDYIDVTRNMMIAYFFAYTYYDKEKNRYFPIENFNEYSPTLYAVSLRDLYYTIPDSVANISWQPLARPKMQQAMSINVSKDWDIVQSLFRKVQLPKNPAISRYVYEMFDCGNLLIPADYITRCANQIREYKTLHNDLIEAYCEETKTDIKWLREELKKLDFEFVEQPWFIPEQANDIINKEIDENIIKYLSKGFAKNKQETSLNNKVTESSDVEGQYNSSGL